MTTLLALALLLAPPEAPADAPTYDVVIRGGKVVDGTGNPWFFGDVAIQGDRIAAVGRVPRDARSKREIDARGLVVAPGFIDMHSHSDWVLLEDGDAPAKIRQGVTTEVLGEGDSGGPRLGKLPAKVVTVKGEEVRLTTLGEYLDALERSGIAPNVATYVGLGNVWGSVMGESFDRPTPAQLDEMKAVLAGAMRDGAFGLSSMLMAPQATVATTEDLVALCRVVREHGGLYSSHIRSEGLDVVAAVREAIAIGEGAGVPVDVIHLKIAEQTLWGRMKELVALIEQARARGVNVQANVYPYTRGNNDLASIIPPGRGVLHGTMALYLARYLNVPPAPASRATAVSSWMICPRIQRQSAPPYSTPSTGRDRSISPQVLVARHLTLGHSPQPLIATLAHAVLREDAGFHAYQMLEAGSPAIRRVGRHGRGPAHPHRGCPLSGGPFTDRTRVTADNRHRPPLDAGDRAA